MEVAMAREISDRMQVLEEKFEYQDQLLESLNEVIVKQQAQLDFMQGEVEKLRVEVSAVLGERKESSDEPRPPHY